MNLELIGKTALISGSTRGIGFAIASQLAAEGAHVIVNGRSDEAVNSAVQQIRKALTDPRSHRPNSPCVSELKSGHTKSGWQRAVVTVTTLVTGFRLKA